MRPSGRALLVPLLAAVFFVLCPPLPAVSTSWAQEDGSGVRDSGEGAEQGDAAGDDAVGADQDLPDIDQILQEDEAVLGGGGNTYDPGDRRDPFRSLLVARQAGEPDGPRPEGVPGLLIDEVIVSGLFRTPGGWVAQVQEAEDDKSYLLEAGDQLYDGEVLSISDNEVVFKQIVRDPTALKPFRDVVKKLNP